MIAEAQARIGECRHWLEQGEQAARAEAWNALPRIQQSYTESFDGLRAMLGEGPLDDDGLRQQLAELELRQRRLIYEFRKAQTLIKARLEDMEAVRKRLGRFDGSGAPVPTSVDRNV